MLRKDPEERCDPRADAAENADAEPLNAVIAAVLVLPEGGLEGALLASGCVRSGRVPSDVDLVGGRHALRVDLAGAFVHRAVATRVAVPGRGRRDGLELVEVVLGEMLYCTFYGYGCSCTSGWCSFQFYGSRIRSQKACEGITVFLVTSVTAPAPPAPDGRYLLARLTLLAEGCSRLLPLAARTRPPASSNLAYKSRRLMMVSTRGPPAVIHVVLLSSLLTSVAPRPALLPL